jgi:predicted nucleic acid-binding protein
VIILDTNVVSELLRPAPDRNVISWVDAQDATEVVITAITAAELRAGVAFLPRGRRKATIATQVEALLEGTFADYVLPFENDSSGHYAAVLAARRRAGRPISALDAQIAAICLQHDAVLATRNTADFARTGTRLINPWTETP